ncbi:potassium channel family protein [Ligilactobacillus sp. WILCCON 0076]|uniref:Potassium channel family protein n=1 Tax=Ligilactobacillus ubinensis TaxID=2876789 RepID=A0A9X2FLP1_9LACO|nr:potassium channel family protein [Ligilactobacillus ubinensis]MCP0887645.1 potassium channel family protein [Ligilactobacillus ubinensis]
MKKLYDIFIVILAVISIAMVILDYCGQLNIGAFPYNIVDNGILIIFAIDYFTRLALSKNKKYFFTHNIFDLLAIIPASSFSLFRVARIARLSRIFRLFRLVGLSGKLQRNAKKFLKTNGLIYLIITCTAILLISAVLYSLSENVSFSESLWWAIATATTVGYGDISPHTAIGKLAAVLLMFVGIGFIGMLTSSITAYFTNEKEDTNAEEKLDFLIKKVDSLENEISSLKEELKNKE